MTHRSGAGAPAITQEMIRLYDDYTHLSLDRRKLMTSLSRIAGGSAAAAAILPLLQAQPAAAQMAPADDPRLSAEEIAWPGAAGEMQGYLARPAEGAESLPAIIVIHENRGLNDHTRDVARRAALEGFVALAPDFLSPAGGTPADEDQARTMIGELDQQALTQNLVATAEFLRGHEAASGAVGVVGFCWGGGMAARLAVSDPDLGAAVSFYGSQPQADEVPQIAAPLMLHYAGLDERINAGIPAFQQALDAAGVDYTIHIYEGVNHAFLNDTSEARYDAAAAELAWDRTIAFFRETLSDQA